MSDNDPGEVYLEDETIPETFRCTACNEEVGKSEFCFTCEECSFCCKCPPDMSERICPYCETQVTRDQLCDECGGCTSCICRCKRSAEAETVICPLCEVPVDSADICPNCGNCLHGCCNC